MSICGLVDDFSFGPFITLCGKSKWRCLWGSWTHPHKGTQRHTKTHTHEFQCRREMGINISIYHYMDNNGNCKCSDDRTHVLCFCFSHCTWPIAGTEKWFLNKWHKDHWICIVKNSKLNRVKNNIAREFVFFSFKLCRFLMYFLNQQCSQTLWSQHLLHLKLLRTPKSFCLYALYLLIGYIRNLELKI